MVELKEMTKEEIDVCSRIHSAVYQHDEDAACRVKSTDYGMTYDYESYFNKFLSSEDRFVLCIIVENRIVGFLSVVKIPSLQGGYSIYIDTMVVDPKYQRKGYGTEAIKLLQQRFDDIWLNTKQDIPANGMYEKTGFIDLNTSMMTYTRENEILKALMAENKRLNEQMALLESSNSALLEELRSREQD